jgi:CRP-like cAMP-binding protein
LPAQRQSFTRVQLLREDPDLGAAIPKEDLSWAIEHCVAPAITIARGAWHIERTDMPVGGIGLLILEGLLLRRVGVDGRHGAELLGEGDLVRPWAGEDLDSTLPYTTGWKVIQRARVAMLDERVAGRLARYPPLIGAIAARALDRARRLALMMAIIHHPRIEVRLHMLFWHLADRWGHVRTDGVILPLSVSHSVLADLVAAQRPSVTGALGKLVERGLVQTVDDGWLLRGEPPGELLELQTVEVPGSGDEASAVAGHRRN